LPDVGAGVLITRPEPGASETAARVISLGLRPIVAPVLDIRILRARIPAPMGLQAILVTSGNAIPALPASHHDLPVLAVGETTAARLRAAGFTRVTSADRDANALATLVAQSCVREAAPLLLITGRGQGKVLATDLRGRGFRVIHRAGYEVVLVTALPQSASDALAAGEVSAALFFSAESARQCVRLMQTACLQEAARTVDALAIGRPAVVALQDLPWRRIRVASRPTQDAMLALLR
jgi:uroporphyrinogen-III synthase